MGQAAEGRQGAQEAAAKSRLPLPILLFLISLQLPWTFNIGSFGLAPYRLVLLVMLPVCFFRWLSGKAGPMRVADLTLLAFCTWCSMALFAVYGTDDAIQPSGMVFIETMGGYLLGRCYVRSADDFRAVVRFLFTLTILILPFALVETLTGRNLLLELLGRILPAYQPADMPSRWGLARVQANALHPIHFGVMIGCTFALTHLVLGFGETSFKRNVRSATVVFVAFLSLSSGPLTGVFGQAFLLGWGRALRAFPMRWGLLIGGIAGLFVLTGLFANRSLPVILIGYFAFDEWSAYIRTLTWEYGIQSILNHPLWGVGFGDWDHPTWLTSSVDMHWLVDSIRHGILASPLLLLSLFSAVLAAGRASGLDERLSAYRSAYVIAMMGFFMAGWAVYLWGTVYALFVFLMGSGLWLAEAGEKVSQQRRTVRPKGVSARLAAPELVFAASS
ncbi:MAG: O-antigen ligase domain-containing protein [Methylobacterium mesophilicum]|nr:O-antigen ligase domain-containing protein [Methylobacterium mesophilicum]